MLSHSDSFHMLSASRKDFQWQRKLFHLFNGTLGFCLYVYSGLSHTVVLSILGFCALVCLILDVIRFCSPVFNAWLSQKTAGVIRQEESNRLTSMTKGLSLAFFVLVLFPEKVGILIMLYMTYADAAAGIVGSLWGRHRLNRHASVEGSSAFFIIAFLSSLFAFFFIFHFPLHSAVFVFAVIASLLMTVIEGLFPNLDDNVTIPLFGASVLYLLFKFFPLNLG